MASRLISYGVTPVFLTDHDNLDGVRQLEAAQLVPAIPGQEVTTSEGELIGLFLTASIEPGLSPDEAVERIKSQGGLVYLQHPLDTRRRSLELSAIERLRDRFDIVEVFNGRSTDDANRRAQDLCLTLGAVPGAGSDAHTLDEIGVVYVELEDFDGPDDFLEKLERGRIVTHPSRWRMRLRGSLRGILART